MPLKIKKNTNKVHFCRNNLCLRITLGIYELIHSDNFLDNYEYILVYLMLENNKYNSS